MCRSWKGKGNAIVRFTWITSALVNFSAGARYTKSIANLVPSSSIFFMQYYFFGSCWPFQIPAPSADNKGGRNLLSGLARATFVIATIIYSSSPPVFTAPRFWEPRDPAQPGFFLEARRENPGNEVAIPSLRSFLLFPWGHRFCNVAPSEIFHC